MTCTRFWIIGILAGSKLGQGVASGQAVLALSRLTFPPYRPVSGLKAESAERRASFLCGSFVCVTSTSTHALLRLEGWRARRGAPLSLEVVLAGGVEVLEPLPGSTDNGAIVWRGGFAVPLELLDAETTFALRCDGQAVPLPSPAGSHFRPRRRPAAATARAEQRLAVVRDALASAIQHRVREREARTEAERRAARADAQAQRLAAELGELKDRLSRSEHERRDAADRTKRLAVRHARMVRHLRGLEHQLALARRQARAAEDARERTPQGARSGKLAWLLRAGAVALVAGFASATIVLAVRPSAYVARRVASLPLPPDASALARAQIPPRYLGLYAQAARRYGLDWTILAAMGEIESDHGRSPLPGVRSGTNPSGAAGPMQFVPAAWLRYGLSIDGGPISVYDPADAINAAASFLRVHGAPQNWAGALYDYNHAFGYVSGVLTLASSFRRAAPASHTTARRVRR
jgi:hypothetical protein